MANKNIAIPKDRLLALMEDIKREQKEEEERERILNDDKYFEKYFNQDKIGKLSFCGKIAPIVRRETYGDSPIYRCQVVQGFSCAEEKSPVVMRGSKWCMQRKYSAKGAMAEIIAERFLKFIRFTCQDVKKFRDMELWLRKKLTQKDWYVHNSFLSGRIPHSGNGLWWKGEWIHSFDDRYIEIMQHIDERKAKQLIKEYEFNEKRKKWLKSVEEKENQRLQKLREENETYKASLKLRREKKAKQIAAYELLMEVSQ